MIKEKASNEKEESKIDWDDVVFEVDLLKSQEINLDYILEQIFEKNKKVKDKATLVEDVRRIIRSSIGNRAKEGLLVDFINQTDLDKLGDKATVIDTFFAFAQAEQRREAEELINSENLNPSGQIPIRHFPIVCFWRFAGYVAPRGVEYGRYGHHRYSYRFCRGHWVSINQGMGLISE